MPGLYWENSEPQGCLNSYVAWIEDWSRKYGRSFEYVYVREIRTLRTGEIARVETPLEISLRESSGYVRVDESDVGVVCGPK